MDWVSTIATEAISTPLLRIHDLASKHQLTSSAVSKALIRQRKRGLIEQLSSDTYFNKLAPSATARELINQLDPASYISLGTALAEWGLSTQSPVATTAVTTSKLRKINTPSINILYRK